ncbi:MAG: hypothetical protein OEV30_05690 [Ignavibacteria bacterium]|nr:hypothetical protein [Ignavibacteria bacterium]
MDLYAEFQKAVRPFVTEVERLMFHTTEEWNDGVNEEEDSTMLGFLSDRPCGNTAAG